MTSTQKFPMEQFSEQIQDPRTQQQIQDWLAKYMPMLEDFEGRVKAQDQDLIQCMSEVALNVCHMCHILNVEFQPEVASILLNQVAAQTANRVEDWKRYAKESSPAVVQRRARDRAASAKG